jgi:RNA polymerase sigma-70 factor (ECF subfamily)
LRHVSTGNGRKSREGVLVEGAAELSLELGAAVGHAARVSVTAADETAALVAAARAGDRGAFGGLYRRYAPMVHGLLLARVPYGEVDDLVQDVFLIALRRLAALRDAGAFGPWVAMIARNRAVDYYRSNRETQELPDQLCGTPHPEGEARTVLAAIGSLSEAYRETLVLRLVEGMSGPEIAARTGLTPASVRVNLHRGMKQLREKLAGDGRG